MRGWNSCHVGIHGAVLVSTAWHGCGAPAGRGLPRLPGWAIASANEMDRSASDLFFPAEWAEESESVLALA